MSLGRQLFKHASIYSFATILGKLASFLMLPVYAYVFDVEGYGVIGMIEAGLGIITVLFAGGFSTAIMRIYHEQNQARKKLALSTGILIMWGLTVPIIILPLIFSASISHVLLGNAKYYPFICLSLVSFVFDVTGSSASTYLIINQRSMLYSAIGLLRLFLGLALNIWLVVILQVGLIGVFLSSLVTALVGTLLFHILAIKENGWGFDRNIAVKLLKFQLPFIPADLIGFVGRQAERIVVRILIGLQGVGILEMAYKFPPLLNLLISIPFTLAWRTKSIEIAEQEGAPEIIAGMFTRYLFFMISAGLIMAVTIQDVLILMTPPSFWTSARIARIEILTTILTGCTTYLSFGIIYRKETKIFAYVRAVVTPIKIALSFSMITMWGLAGAAYSALIAEAITTFWIVRKSQGIYRIPLQYWKIVGMAASAIVIYAMLNGNHYHSFRPAVYAREQILPVVADFLGSTPLGEWKSGKIIKLIMIKQDTVISLFFNTLLSISFIATICFLRIVFFTHKPREVNNV
jgi:O-antigen/teichoic acid export membrane protein